jgi:hypothetical protein
MANPLLFDPATFRNLLGRENRGGRYAHDLPEAFEKCDHRSEGRKYRRCRCPIWANGSIASEGIRLSLKTRNWEEAQEKVRDWESERSRPQEPEDNRTSLDQICEKYLADARSRQLGTAALYKYCLLTRQIKAFADSRGIRFIEEFNLALLRDFRAT